MGLKSQQRPSVVKHSEEEVPEVTAEIEAAAEPQEAAKIAPTKIKTKIKDHPTLAKNPIKRVPGTLTGLLVRPVVAIGQLEKELHIVLTLSIVVGPTSLPHALLQIPPPTEKSACLE